MKSIVFKLLVLAASCVPAAAPAATMIAVYRGTVDSGYDNDGLFGGMPNLAGIAYEARFKYDSDTGLGGPGPGGDTRQGGTYYNTVGPILSATLTINGITASVPFTYDNHAITSRYYVQHRANRTAALPTIQTMHELDLNGFAPDAPLLLSSTYAETAMYLLGSYNWHETDLTIIGGAVTHDVNLTLNGFGTYEVIAAPAGPSPGVPEPASWAMLIGGFALVGFARRRAVAAFG